MRLKKLAAFLIAVAAAALLCVAGTVAVYSEDTAPQNSHDHSGWTEWTSDNSLPTESGNYYLTGSVTYTTNMWIDIKSGNTVNICLNGNSITFTKSAGYYRVLSGAALNIYDCVDECGTVTGSSRAPIQTSGNTTLYNGNIVCGNGDGITVSSGGDLTIKGGHISGSKYGVLANDDANITMTGGTVDGGNVGIWSHSMHISGGTVFGDEYGIHSFGPLTVSGDVKISGNEHAIGHSRGGELIIEGGTIESSNDQGRPTITISSGSYVEISGGVIKGDYCITTMSDIVLSGTPTIEAVSASFDLSTYNSTEPKLIITEKLDSDVCYSVRTDCLYSRGFYVFTDSSDTDFNVLANFETSPELKTYNGGYIIIKKSNGQLALAQNIYTVTYDGGEHGEGEIEAASEPNGTNAVLSSEKFTRTGHIQTGWAIIDGGEKVYDFGDTYSDNADITLYPAWTACDHSSETPKWTNDENGGTHSRICEYCGATVNENHNFGDWAECEDGETHIRTCVDCKATETKEHIFNDWTECEDGKTHIRTCADCKATETKEHIFNDWTDCEDGKTHIRTCSACKAEETASHTEGEGEVTKEATDTEDGEMTYKCKDCGYVMRTEPIPAASGNTPVPPIDQPPVTDPDTDTDAGNVNVDSNSGENAPRVSIDGETAQKLEEEVMTERLTEEEREAVANGADLDIILSVEDAGNTVPAEDKQAAETVMADNGYVIGQYLNIDLLKLINGELSGRITRLNTPISITIEIPDGLRGENRAFAIVRVHDGKAEILEDQDNDPNTITILTDKFSTYAIVYQDNAGTADDNPNTGAVLIAAPFIAAAAAVILSKKRKH